MNIFRRDNRIYLSNLTSNELSCIGSVFQNDEIGQACEASPEKTVVYYTLSDTPRTNSTLNSLKYGRK